MSKAIHLIVLLLAVCICGFAETSATAVPERLCIATNRQHYLPGDTIFCGQIVIPSDVPKSILSLRAWTKAIANIPFLECVQPVVIENTTKDGNFIPSSEQTPNIKKVFPQGYQIYHPFTASTHTLYWSPAIQTIHHQRITLRVAKNEGMFVNILGLTADGQAIQTSVRLTR